MGNAGGKEGEAPSAALFFFLFDRWGWPARPPRGGSLPPPLSPLSTSLSLPFPPHPFLQLRLDKDQRIALEEAEAAVDEAKADLKAAEGEDGGAGAGVEAAKAKVGAAEAKLASLEEAFTADALAKALDANAPRPSERRRALDEAEYGGYEGRGGGRGDHHGDRGPRGGGDRGDRGGGDRGDHPHRGGGGGGGDSQEYANFGGRAGAGGGGNYNQDR